MSSLYKRIELVANVAIIVVAVLVGYVVVTKYVLNGSGRSTVKAVTAGTKMNLENVDWQTNGRTMLLVLSEGCHFCSDSAPFYKRLVEEAGRQKVKLLAVFPPKTSNGAKYLEDLKLPITDVKMAPLETIGVMGTPTLILVDSSGVVSKVWSGQLPVEKENDVLSSLQPEAIAS